MLLDRNLDDKNSRKFLIFIVVLFSDFISQVLKFYQFINNFIDYYFDRFQMKNFTSIFAKNLKPLSFNSLTTKTKCYSSYSLMKKALQSRLFQIALKEKCVTKQTLSLIYTPGVGQVCKRIENQPRKVNVYTNRKKAIAIVSNGEILGVQGKKIFPFMDWLIVQIKYYSGLDAYPFAIDKTSNIKETIKDLSNSFGTILLLQDTKQIDVDSDSIIANYKLICETLGSEIVDAEKASKILSYFIDNGKTGWITENDIIKGKQHQTSNLKSRMNYRQKFHGNSLRENSARVHQFYRGKIEIQLNFFDINKLRPLFTLDNFKKLTLQTDAYSKSSNLCAIVTDGTAILGFGNIGPKAGLPVMQGKSCLFKHLGNVEVVPVCINPRSDPLQSIEAIRKLTGNFAGINLQDITSPHCFTIQQGLKKFDFPVFHDDQHGTAIVVHAGLINASKLIHKPLQKCKVVINGAGAAGITIARVLQAYGVHDIIICDTKGSLYIGRPYNMNKEKEEIANLTNHKLVKGSLEQCLHQADIFVGVSTEGALKGQWIQKMHKKNIIFALANPTPQILPEDAKKNGAYIVATGRSDFQNQINNSLVFPGIFRAILDHKIKYITMQMKIATAEAIAKSVQGEITRTNIIPSSLDPDIAITISEQIGKIIRKS